MRNHFVGQEEAMLTIMSVPHNFGCSTMSSSWSQSRSYPSPNAESVIPAPFNRDLKVQTHEPTGLEYTWRFWRHCCCRYGSYPLALAPLVTIGCLLSIYSAFGCNFVLVEIGFLPSNGSWNESSSAQFGLFSYQSGQPETNIYRETLLDGCREYPDRFSDIFIDGDRTWKVARVMASVSGIASLVGAVSSVVEQSDHFEVARSSQCSAANTCQITSWLFVISPIPVSFFWPGVLMPALVAAFLSEGSKFLLFDASMCRNTVWFPAGSDSVPQIAESCSLGSSSYCCIAAGVAFFFSLLLVCVKVPTKRILDSDYGSRIMVVVAPRIRDESPANVMRNGEESSRERDMYSDDPNFSESRVSSIPDDRSEMHLSIGVSRSSRDYRSDPENPLDSADSLSGYFSSSSSRAHNDLVRERLRSLDGNSAYSRNASRIEEGEDDSSSSSVEQCNPTHTNKKGATELQVKPVSESRLHTAERLRLSSSTESRDLIERFVKEVNHAFADNRYRDSTIPEERETENVQQNVTQRLALWKPRVGR